MTVFPIYVLADRSASMATMAGTVTAIDAVNTVIRELIDELSRDPTVQKRARLGVISFSEDASVELPLTRLTSATVSPTLLASGGTSFAAAFETTARAVAADLPALEAPQNPMVFMLTDGRTNASRDSRRGWRAEHRALLEAAGPGLRVQVIPFGFGKVDAAALAEIASDPTAAYLAGQNDTPAEAIERFAELIFGSVTSSVAYGEPLTVPPPGSRVLPFDEI
ncbi:hypothetical protein Misp01_43210 [Microtetraspora sp. NBRC 13810]|uniref:vWA domain-containing protein n=1 Tax=Microtetraspora sp. NBRC 13810 TaxID=3030990 RepID=UPI0024A3A612|nr:VWA domain-containing protein [Microtetraspora sp. NBRC 13810]GLW09192.1 hypothetical protein Misp01_43210 [Microtetraspora sp. NBRC 13810]